MLTTEYFFLVFFLRFVGELCLATESFLDIEVEILLHTFLGTHFFYRQLDFSSELGVAKEFWENKAESCLVVA